MRWVGPKSITPGYARNTALAALLRYVEADLRKGSWPRNNALEGVSASVDRAGVPRCDRFEHSAGQPCLAAQDAALPLFCLCPLSRPVTPVGAWAGRDRKRTLVKRLGVGIAAQPLIEPGEVIHRGADMWVFAGQELSQKLTGYACRVPTTLAIRKATTCAGP